MNDDYEGLVILNRAAIRAEHARVALDCAVRTWTATTHVGTHSADVVDMASYYLKWLIEKSDLDPD